MIVDADNAKPPSPFLLAAEWRAMFELGVLPATIPWLSTFPKGDGHPVLVLPGLSAGDISTLAMRTFLKSKGYAVYGWALGPNKGFHPGLKELKEKRLREIYEEHGQKVSLIGWSLGGIYARQLAKSKPEMVRDVITLGSPFKGHPKSSNAWRLYEYLAGHSVDEIHASEETALPPKVPCTSVFSRTDGVVAWECCIENEGEIYENIGLEGSHSGLGHNPLALYVIADRLAQAKGEWKPFNPQSPFVRALFTDLDLPQATAA